MTARIPADAYALFDERNLAHVATLMPDGSPQVTPVWVEREGDRALLFNTAKGRVKHRNLQRDPRVALSVHAQDDLYTYLQVRGRAELIEEGARAHIDRLSNKYLGRDYPFLSPGEQRVIVRVTPDSMQLRGRQ